MKFFDRLLTIVITATLTSAGWIVFGSSVMDIAASSPDEAGASLDQDETPAEVQPVPTPGTTAQGAGEGAAAAAPPAGAATASPAPSASPVPGARGAGLTIPVEGIDASALEDSFLEPRGPDGTRLHEAIDIVAPAGTPVLAAAGGRIAKLHNSTAGGKAIYIRSGDGLRLYYYAHLRDYARNLDEGDRVAAGDPLGTVGSSGNAEPDTPHLHFAVLETSADAQWWEPANAINPYPLLTGER